MTDDFYDLLDVSSDASQDEIKDAYREKVRIYHPDLNDDDRARAQFTAITKANEILTDPVERKAYDRLGHETYVSKRTSGIPSADVWQTVGDDASDDGDDGGEDSQRSDGEASDDPDTDASSDSSEPSASATGTRSRSRAESTSTSSTASRSAATSSGSPAGSASSDTSSTSRSTTTSSDVTTGSQSRGTDRGRSSTTSAGSGSAASSTDTGTRSSQTSTTRSHSSSSRSGTETSTTGPTGRDAGSNSGSASAGETGSATASSATGTATGSATTATTGATSTTGTTATTGRTGTSGAESTGTARAAEEAAANAGATGSADHDPAGSGPLEGVVGWWRRRNVAMPLLWSSLVVYLLGLAHYAGAQTQALGALWADLTAAGFEGDQLWAVLTGDRYGLEPAVAFVAGFDVPPALASVVALEWPLLVACVLGGAIALVGLGRLAWQESIGGPITMGETVVLAVALAVAAGLTGGPVLAGAVLLPFCFGVVVHHTRRLPGWTPSYLYVLPVLGPAAGLGLGTIGYVALPLEIVAFAVLPIVGGLWLPLRATIRKRFGR